ncbi:MAG: glucokinase [Gammaproteobacteria bacterium]|nr:glucokinase [Gammaproteobacteria bacterium]
MLLIAGDIGGTKTLLSLFETTRHGFNTLYARRFVSTDYASFDDLAVDFMAEISTRNIEALCLGVAGPVDHSNGHSTATATNLPWSLDSRVLAKKMGVSKVSLINDFAAMAYGVTALSDDDLITLQQGTARRGGHCVVLGAGTGLGVAQLVSINKQYHVISSEAGHSGFAPFNDDTAALSQHYIHQFGSCSIETVLSGPGINHIFQFVCDTADGQTSLARDSNAATIATSTDAAANKTMQLFASIYGSVAGNLALTNLAYGGVYLTGGVAAKNSELLQTAAFSDAFHHKGKMSRLMSRFPVHIVTNEHCGLLGAAVAASRL